MNTMMEFRAGKMSVEGKTVVPDTRKGLIRITRGEEGLVHFQWLDRLQNVVEHDEIIFPDEAVFEKVNQSSGRVYILKFNTDNRKYFFWMQEPKADGDPQLCESVNYYINRPLEFVDEPEDASAPPPNPEDFIMDEDMLSRAEDLIGSNTGAQENSNLPSSSGPVRFEDLQRILSNIGPEGLELGDIFRSDLIQPLINTLPVEERLAPYLPEGQWNVEEFVQLLQSPPFRQQVDAFTYVLRTGQIDLTQFGIDPSKYKFTVTSFLEALEDSVSVASPAEDDKNSLSQSRNPNDSMDESH